MHSDYRQVSFWHDSLPGPLAPRPPLDGDARADVVIIGAGYTGLWTAYYLKRLEPSLEVLLLEAEIAGFGASGRNGGWCSSHLSGIHHWLDDPEHRAAGLRLQRQMFDTVHDIGAVLERESIDAHYDCSGALDIAVLPAQLNRLKAELGEWRRLGVGEEDYRWLEAQELTDLVRVDGALGALHLSHCAAVHPARLARGLAECVERMGVRIIERSPVQKIDGHDLTTPGGKVHCDTLLVATEGYSRGLVEHHRSLIPVHSMMVATEPLSPVQLESTGLSRRCTFGNGDRVVTYGQLTADSRIAFGCRGTYLYRSGIRQAFQAGERDFDRVRETLLRFFPGLEGVGFSHAWGGAMGVSRALRPSVNFDPVRREGWAGGYFGSGVAATHLAGRTLADLVAGRDTDRVQTPWVNPPDARKRWEPEPLRWLGIRYARAMMTFADHVEYRAGRYGTALGRMLDAVIPEF